MPRVILHCDADGFYAAVECALNPELLTVPMAVAGSADNRHGIILAKNQLAKNFGVKTAETVWQARQKCPNLLLAKPHHHTYSEFSERINAIYQQFSDLCEPFGIDETFIDVTNVKHLFGDGKTIADTLRTRIKAEIGVTISVGVSFNKIFAKLGSELNKPDGTAVITAENYERVVFPLPVNALLYVGKAANKTLNDMGILTIGDLANCDKEGLIRRLGKHGEMLHDYANGLDDSPVAPYNKHHGIKSVGNGMTFRRDLVGYDDIYAAVSALTDEVSARMRKYGVKCRTVSVTIKTPDLKSVSRQITLDKPTNFLKDLRGAAMAIMRERWSAKKPIRMLTVTANNLTDDIADVEQLSLFESETGGNDKQERLTEAFDHIRRRYGENALKLGVPVVKDLWGEE